MQLSPEIKELFHRLEDTTDEMEHLRLGAQIQRKMHLQQLRQYIPEGVDLFELPDDYGMGFGWESPSGVEIHLAAQIFNWRISEVDGPLSYGRHWCYAGRCGDSFALAVKEMIAWGGDPDDIPSGWIKGYDEYGYLVGRGNG